MLVVLIAAAACLLLLRAHRQADAAGPPATSASSPAAQAQTPTAGAAGVASTALPAGWQWYTASAKTLGTNAGFKLAIPDGWNAYPKGAGVLFEAPGNDTFLQVDLTPHTKSSMLAEARYLAELTQRQGKFPGYSDQSIRSVNIRNSAGAAWGFTWQDATLGRIRALDLMYNARTWPASSRSRSTCPRRTRRSPATWPRSPGKCAPSSRCRNRRRRPVSTSRQPAHGSRRHTVTRRCP